MEAAKEGMFAAMKTRLGIVVLLCCMGCCTIPFQRICYTSVKEVDAVEVRDNFAHLLPMRFQVVDSIVFRYGPTAIACIGYTDVNIAENSFKAVCLNHMGVKLLELEVTGDNIERRYVFEELREQEDVLRPMSKDIRRIYFDRVPSPKAEYFKRRNKIIFKQPFKDGSIEYVFAGTENRLIEKRYFEDNDLIWSVFYYEYKQKDGKLFPGGIILKHHQYDYKLVIRLKEIRT